MKEQWKEPHHDKCNDKQGRKTQTMTVEKNQGSIEKEGEKSQKAATQVTTMVAQPSESTEGNATPPKLLPPLKVGTKVKIQNVKTGLWDREGRIISAWPFGDYHVGMPSGESLWSSRAFLCPLRAEAQFQQAGEPEPKPKVKEKQAENE